MEDLTTISIHKQTKKELNKLKLCRDESYNSMLKRVLPKWAEVILNELNEDKEKPSQASSNNANEKGKDS